MTPCPRCGEENDRAPRTRCSGCLAAFRLWRFSAEPIFHARDHEARKLLALMPDARVRLLPKCGHAQCRVGRPCEEARHAR